MKRRLLLLALAAAGAAPGAGADSAQTAYETALKLLRGAGGKRDQQAAARQLEQAARQQHVGAQGLLGWMAMSGVSRVRDEARAAHGLRAAAEAGDTAAQNNLGVLYALGTGVPHDHAQAEHWFRAAAAQGAEDARGNLDALQRPASPGSSMSERRRLSHDGFRDRFKRAHSGVCVENVGWNHRTPDALLEGWQRSPDHHRNLVEPKVARMGIAVATRYVTFFACR